ncbi:MAG: hypothetical protein O2884_10230 [Chloroflexi bacterium]|nr:hypothetical protein [Chloroflexota bacterium]
MVMRRLLGQRSGPVPVESTRDFQRDASNLLAVFRFFAVVVLVTLTAVLETTSSQQTSLVVLATIAAIVSLVIVAIGVRLVTFPRVMYSLLVIDTVLSVVGILDGGYVLPAVTLNGYTPVITVTAPPRADMAPFGAVFVDPQTATTLNPLGSNASFEYQIENVQPFADFQISWVYTPSGNNWRLRVYEGAGTGGSLVETANGNSSPARLTVEPDDVNGGTYTIEFSNQQSGAITSAAFSSIGDPSNTWVRIIAFKDYLIEATAGEQTVTAFAR